MNTPRVVQGMKGQLGKFENHLRFNLRCSGHRLIPNSMRLGSTVKGRRAREILEKAQNPEDRSIS